MIVNQRILCPTDLPMESDEAVRYAMALSSAAEIDLNRILVAHDFSTHSEPAFKSPWARNTSLSYTCSTF